MPRRWPPRATARRRPARWRCTPTIIRTCWPGQGTVGREFEQDAPDLTHILVATGGGGLIGGIAAWYAGSAEVISVEPEGCPGLHDALRPASRSTRRLAAWPPTASARGRSAR